MTFEKMSRPQNGRYQLLESADIYRNVAENLTYREQKQCAKILFVFAILLTSSILFYFPLLSVARKPIVFVWPANQSRDANVLVRPGEVTTRIWPSNACQGGKSAKSSAKNSTYLLVVVCSALKNSAERQTIRETWASDHEKLPDVKVIFLVGRVGNETSEYQVNVTREADEHGDILQEDFGDSYANLTVKSLMLLKWYSRSCQSVPYVLKTDDDVYVNLELLRRLVATNRKPGLLVGSLICGAAPIRDPYNKWFAPGYMYGPKKYPNYLSGTAYLMSRRVATRLFDASLAEPAFHLEDIFVTGILAQSAGIRPEDNVGFSYVKRRPAACLYRQTISSHHLAMPEMRSIHEKVVRTSDKCGAIKKKFLRTYGPGKCTWPKAKPT